MLINKLILRVAGTGLAAIVLLAVRPLRAQTSSEAQQIQELKREVAELRQEVNSLKKHEASEPSGLPGGPTKTEVSYDGKTYVEKSVPLENPLPTSGNYRRPSPRWNSMGTCGSVTSMSEARPKAGVQ